jgi:plasmid stabilization system protein ParE
LGRELPELKRSEYRDWIVGPYRVIYRVDAAHRTLVVIAVVHGARRLSGAVGDRLPKRHRKPRRPTDE